MNGLLLELPPLLALSANSPFWRGEPTGLSSTQAAGLRRIPALRATAPFQGLRPTTPRSSASSRRPAASPTTRTSGGTSAPTRGWARWRSGVCDAVTRVEHAVALAAYCQALVKMYSERFDRGEEIRSYHRILTNENKWLAARYGLEAPLMDLETGRRNRAPVAQLVRRRLKELVPHARSSARRASSRGSRTSSPTGAGPTASCASSTRTVTSSRSSARSPTRPRPPPSPPSWTSRSRRPRMDLVGESARIVSARWWAPAGRSAPGFGARKRVCLGPRGFVPRALAACASSRVSRRPGRSGRRGHRPGGLPRRAAQPGPLRSPPAVRALAAPDRRQPGDRLGPRAGAAAGGVRGRGHGRVRHGGISARSRRASRPGSPHSTRSTAP